jgi:3'-phosphoadenosine 5'-phosphosulfate (PAPS) 3'-phosphatase
LPPGLEGRPELRVAIDIALEAGAVIEAFVRLGFARHEKTDSTPVTEADLAADAIITSRLRDAFPEDGLISEESGLAPGVSRYLWCVDPLDGTEAFIDGSRRGYAVQIARLERVDGGWSPVLGVVYEPRHDELFYGAIGLGAFASIAGSSSSIFCPTSSSKRFVTSSRVDRALCSRLEGAGFRNLGELRSVGVKVGRLLLGEADAYLATHPLSWWDLAAPQVILEAAGGRVTSLSGANPCYDDRPGAPLRIESPLVFSLGLPHESVLSAFT